MRVTKESDMTEQLTLSLFLFQDTGFSMAAGHSSIREVAKVRSKTPGKGENVMGTEKNIRSQWEPLCLWSVWVIAVKPAFLSLMAPLPS